MGPARPRLRLPLQRRFRPGRPCSADTLGAQRTRSGSPTRPDSSSSNAQRYRPWPAALQDTQPRNPAPPLAAPRDSAARPRKHFAWKTTPGRASSSGPGYRRSEPYPPRTPAPGPTKCMSTRRTPAPRPAPRANRPDASRHPPTHTPWLSTPKTTPVPSTNAQRFTPIDPPGLAAIHGGRTFLAEMKARARPSLLSRRQLTTDSAPWSLERPV